MLIMQWQGGLGNQLFEYACYRALVSKGRKVKVDNSFFTKYTKMYALNCFANIKIRPFHKFCGYPYYILMKVLQKLCRSIHLHYSENEEMPYDENVFKRKIGFLTGYFQNELYFRDIAEEIREELQFPIGEEKLQRLVKKLEDGFYISIHIRRGDYLKFAEIYGGICDGEYYRKAIQVMAERYPNAKFMVFSDDIPWVKENMEIPNAEYVPREEIKHYEDWYDMCLMSHCKHNIIANSTFSWWGAWLNKNKNKTVICPTRWDNIHPNRGKVVCDGWTSI